MTLLTKTVYLSALVVWLGGIVFFSFVGAPALFGALPRAEAGRAVGAVFPLYYAVGYVCGSLLLITCAVFAARSAQRTVWVFNALLVTAMLLATLYAGRVVQPRAAALRPQLHAAEVRPEVRREFDHLHRRAVQLNGFVLVCGLVVCGVTAARLRP